MSGDGEPSGRPRTYADVRAVPDGPGRRRAFLAWLDRRFRDEGASPPYVVGGAAVELYTGGAYATGDLDLKCPPEALAGILGAEGFRKIGRHWVDPEANLFVDWLGHGPEPPHERADAAVLLHLPEGTVLVISPEDLVLDRIRAAVHWRDQDSALWARAIVGAIAASGLPFDWDSVTARLEDDAERALASDLQRDVETDDVLPASGCDHD